MSLGSPDKVGTLHFVGIGGIGISGLAEIFHELGYTVQGSDLSGNKNTERLQAKGIKVFLGQKAENIEGARIIGISTAVKDDNPEVVAAKAAGIPVIRRVELLQSLMRMVPAIAISGAHGKTTTTSLTAAALDKAGIDPTVVNGGIIHAYGTNARLGKGPWMVVEADESDGTFTGIPAQICVITNIDREHLNHYGTFDILKDSFKQFVQNLPFFGLAIISADCPIAREVFNGFIQRKILTYGFATDADVRIEVLTKDPTGSQIRLYFSEQARDFLALEASTLETFVPMVGEHNIANATAAIIASLECDVSPSLIPEIFSDFKGVGRRFQEMGNVGGVRVIDDYAHHPTEVKKVYEAAKSVCTGKLHLVVQPHRFSRLQDLWQEWQDILSQVEHVVLMPVFRAGEEPIVGIDEKSLADALQEKTGRSPLLVETPDDLARALSPSLSAGDMILCTGAGSITAFAKDLPEALSLFLGQPSREERQVG